MLERNRKGRRSSDGPFDAPRVSCESDDLVSAAATTALRHELVVLGLLLVGEERLDGVVHLRASGLHLLAGFGVATARGFHEGLHFGLIRLVDRVGLRDDRVGHLERVLEDRGWVRATTAATTAALSLCGRRCDREQRD